MSDENDQSGKPVEIHDFNGKGAPVSKRLRDALRARYQQTLNEPMPDRLKSLVERVRDAERKKR